MALLAGCQGAGPRSDWAAQFAAVGVGDAIIFRAEGEPIDDAAPLPDELTFERATRESLRTSPEIQAALAKVRMAEAEADQARLLPNPVFSLVVRFRHESPIITPSISEELLSILQRGSKVSAADKRLRAATADALTAVLGAIAEVQEAYLVVRTVDDELAVFAERKRLIEKLADLARSRLKAGEGTRLDVLTLDAQRLQLEVEIADKQLERSQDRLLLARLVGRPSGSADWQLTPWDAPASVSGAEGKWVRAALLARPEVQSKLWELAALGDEATMARWAAWEGLAAGAEAERDITWSVGPSISLQLPLFDTGGAKRDRAIAELIGARHELAQAQRQVIEDVRKAYAGFHLAQAALAKVRDELSPIQNQRRAQAEAAYRAGETDLTTLLVADQDLQETRQKLIELREKASVAFVRLQRAVGGAGTAGAVRP